MLKPQELNTLYSRFDAHKASEGQVVNNSRRTIYSFDLATISLSSHPPTI